jgi:hypothetical protein
MLIDRNAIYNMNIEQARGALTLLLLAEEHAMTHEDAAQQVEEVTDGETVQEVRARVLAY